MTTDNAVPSPLADRLIAAIEGECDGLAIDGEQASNILAYLQYGRAIDSVEGLLRDAMRYRKLREADINAVHKGGVFAGLTPDNVVINGEDLDIAVDLLIDDTTPASAIADAKGMECKCMLTVCPTCNNDYSKCVEHAPFPALSEGGERAPTGDQLRAIIRSVGSFGTNHDDAPMEYVLAGWRAALARASTRPAGEIDTNSLVTRLRASSEVTYGDCDEAADLIEQQARRLVRCSAQNLKIIKIADERAARLNELERIFEGLPQDAIDGGWTAKGMSAYAKGLEEQRAELFAFVCEFVDAWDNGLAGEPSLVRSALALLAKIRGSAK